MKKRILLVDDEPDLRLMLGETLREAGYDVIEADDGLAAYTMFFEDKPDLMIIDVLLSKMNGNEVVKRVHNTPEGKYLPVIVLTGRHLMKEYFTNVKIEAFIEKPFNTAEFLETVERLLVARERVVRQLEVLEKNGDLPRMDERLREKIKVCEVCSTSMPANLLRCPNCGSVRLKEEDA